MQRWLATLSQKLGGIETIGNTENLLEGVEPAVRGRETALGNLLADAAREQMQTDVAVINGGSIRINDNIPPGPITKYDMEGIFYYTNTLVAFRVTGQQLLDMLNNSVSRVDAGDGRFLQVSGLSFASATALDGEGGGRHGQRKAARPRTRLHRRVARLHVPERLRRRLHPLRRRHTSAEGQREREADFRKTVENTIRAKGTVDTAVEGRIVRK